MELERSVIIHRPVEDVFALAADPDKDSLWGSLIVESRRLSDGAIGVGSRYQQTANFMGSRVTTALEITAYEPNRMMCYRLTEPVILEHCRRFEAAAEGTRLTFVVAGDLGARFKAASSLLIRIAQRQVNEDLKSMKAMLEKTGGAAT